MKVARILGDRTCAETVTIPAQERSPFVLLGPACDTDCAAGFSCAK